MAVAMKLEKNKLVAEDFQVGIGSVTQIRQGEETQLTEVNAANLLGPLVIDTIAKLQDLDANLLLSQTVIVKENHTIYTWDSTNKEWISAIKGIYVIDSAAEFPEVPQGYNTVLCDGYLYTKINDQWLLKSDNTVYAINSYSDIDALPNGVQSVIVKTTGLMYYKDGLNWIPVQFGNVSDNIKVVTTIQELIACDPNIYSVVFLDMQKRSGYFFYDETKKNMNEGGIIFNGWIRQYSGEPSIFWYGVEADGLKDDTQAFGAYLLQHSSITLSDITLNIQNNISITKDVVIKGNGAKLKLKSGIKLQITGQAHNPIEIQNTIQIGQNTFNTVSASGYKIGELMLLKGDGNKSFFASIANISGTTITLDQGSKAILVNPKLYRIAAPVFEMSGVTIEQENTNLDECIKLQYCKEVKIQNCKFNNINCTYFITLDKCYNVAFNQCIINNVGQTSNAIRVIDSDNTIIQSCKVFGQLNALIFENVASTNQIGIFESVISSSNSSNANNSLKLHENVSGVSIRNSQLLGNMLINGGSFVMQNCIVSVYDKLTLNKLTGGMFRIDNNVFSFLITSKQNFCIGNDDVTNLKAVTSNIDFEIVNNTFIVTSLYTHVFKAVGNDTALHNLLYKDNKVIGATVTDLALSGAFGNLLLNTGSEKVTINEDTTNIATFSSFNTEVLYTTTKLCFKDTNVNDANITTVSSSVNISSGQTHNTKYALKHPICNRGN